MKIFKTGCLLNSQLPTHMPVHQQHKSFVRSASPGSHFRENLQLIFLTHFSVVLLVSGLISLQQSLRVMAIKKSTLGTQFFFKDHLTARWCVVPFFNKIYGCSYFLKTCRAPALCTMPFFLLDPQYFVISSGYRVV